MSKKKRITDIFEVEEILKTADLDILKKTSSRLPEQLPKIKGKGLPKRLPKYLEGWTLRKEFITVKGEKYGPYLYAYKKIKGKLHKKYVGRVT